MTVVPPGPCSGRACPIVEAKITPLPNKLTYHPLDGNLVYDLPLYDKSYYPPKLVGHQVLLYTHNDVHWSWENALLPSDPITWASTLQTLGSKALILASKTDGAIAMFVGPICPECTAALSVVAAVDSTNSAVTIDGHLETKWYPAYKSPFNTPFDPQKKR